MLAGEIQKNYIFPRIPLSFSLPESYPDAGVISNISVTPVITNYKFTRDEIELEGRYTVAVSFYKKERESVTNEYRDSEPDDFFSRLKLEDNGLLSDGTGETAAKIRQNSLELYTVHFSRQFHTYVDLDFVTKPRSFRPGMVVEKAGLQTFDGRNLKGELVLGLINKPRRVFR